MPEDVVEQLSARLKPRLVQRGKFVVSLWQVCGKFVVRKGDPSFVTSSCVLLGVLTMCSLR
jgi:hypothetical protein